MSFYNPMKKGPDFGQGIQDAMYQFIQMMMMKQMMGGQQGAGAQGQAPLGQAGGQVGPPQMQGQAQVGGPPPGQGMAQMGSPPPQPNLGASAQGGIGQMGSTPPQGGMNPMLMQLAQNPQMMQMIMRLMQGRQ